MLQNTYIRMKIRKNNRTFTFGNACKENSMHKPPRICHFRNQ